MGPRTYGQENCLLSDLLSQPLDYIQLHVSWRASRELIAKGGIRYSCELSYGRIDRPSYLALFNLPRANMTILMSSFCNRTTSFLAAHVLIRSVVLPDRVNSSMQQPRLDSSPLLTLKLGSISKPFEFWRDIRQNDIWCDNYSIRMTWGVEKELITRIPWKRIIVFMSQWPRMIGHCFQVNRWRADFQTSSHGKNKNNLATPAFI